MATMGAADTQQVASRKQISQEINPNRNRVHLPRSLGGWMGVSSLGSDNCAVSKLWPRPIQGGWRMQRSRLFLSPGRGPACERSRLVPKVVGIHETKRDTPTGTRGWGLLQATHKRRYSNEPWQATCSFTRN